MSKLLSINKEYAEWLKSLSQRFHQSQIKAAVKVNSELLKFYWSLGQDIVERGFENTYGSEFFKNLSLDLQEEFPNTKGFSPTNLGYIKRFYILYSNAMKISPQVEGKSPIGVSSVDIFDNLTADFKSALPSIEDIENELRNPKQKEVE